jgi:two-component system response regulator AtoC
VDVRVLAATSRDLEQEVRDGRFREDLFYRLNVVRIEVPPLRARREDIPVLVDHFFARFRDELGRDVRGIRDDALAALVGYAWPGNVRELENVIERALILARGEMLSLGDLPENVTAAPAPDATTPGAFSLKEARRAMEERLIRRALEATDGNRTHAAKLLEISHRALLYKLKDYGIR